MAVEVLTESDPTTAPRRRWRPEYAAWLVAATAFLAGTLFVLVNVYYNHGRFIPALDDAYIHMQYGAQMGRGAFLRFQDGDPVSTGASSLLYVMLLGVLYFLGAQGGLLVPAAVLFGLVCHAAASAGIVALGRRMGAQSAGTWAGVLTALSGPLLWGATSGMEISLTAMLLVTTMLMFVRESPGPFRFTPVLAALAVLSRMEELAFFALLPLVLSYLAWQRPGKRLTRLGATVWHFLPVFVLAAQLLIYKLATGNAAPNGSQAKSYLSMPNFNLGELVGRTGDNFQAFLQIFTGITRQDIAFPGALLLAGIAVAVLMSRPGKQRWVALIVGSGTVLALGATSTMSTAMWQQLRYIQPLIPLFLLFTVLGIGAVRTRIGLSSRAGTGLVAVAALFTAAWLPHWAHVTIQDSASIRERLVTIAAWAKGNLPADARLGVHDVGAAAYLSGRHTVDLVGLTTNGLAKPALNGIGSLYEAIHDLPANQRPDYVAAYNSMPGGVELDKLADGSAYAEPVLTTPVLTVWRCDWSLLGSGDRPSTPVAGQIRDYVNIGSMSSEQAHQFEFHAARSDFPPITELRTVDQGGHKMVDSARHIWGEQDFTLHHLQPGKPLQLVARYDSRDPMPGRYTAMREVRVFAGGTEIGKHRLDPTADGWAETTIDIPPQAVTGTDLTIRLAAPQQFVGPYPDYKSFGFWAVQ